MPGLKVNRKDTGSIGTVANRSAETPRLSQRSLRRRQYGVIVTGCPVQEANHSRNRGYIAS
jgi:hypothetical protein